MQIRIQVIRGGERPRGCRRRRALLVAAIAAAVAAPFAYSTVRDDVFSDVPATAADHDAINRVYSAGIMKPCATSPTLQFCPNNTMLRRGGARQYDYILGLSGVPGSFTPTWSGGNFVNDNTAPPFTVDSSRKVVNLNADYVDDIDGRNIVNGVSATNPLVARSSTGQTMFERTELNQGDEKTILVLPGLAYVNGVCTASGGGVSLTGTTNGLYVVSTRFGGGGPVTPQAFPVNMSNLSVGVNRDEVPPVESVQFQGGIGHDAYSGEKYFSIEATVDANYLNTGHCLVQASAFLQTT